MPNEMRFPSSAEAGAIEMFTVFWIRVDITLERPLEIVSRHGEDSGELARGAIMSFGVTAANDTAAIDLVRAAIRGDPRFQDLAYAIAIDFLGEIEDLEKEIYADDEVASALTQDPSAQGLWYRTGAGWYSESPPQGHH
jgi:hypothetical protein